LSGRRAGASSRRDRAWLNERRLHVEPTALSGRSLFSIRAPFEGDIPAAAAGWLRRYRLRRFGSTALQLCYVALGALAFVHDHGASVWDIAGAAPVILEAGGRLTTPRGEPLFPIRPGGPDARRMALLAGDPSAHALALADLQRAADWP
jgi:myo-inositol-1(or 4)-monophosphatase